MSNTCATQGENMQHTTEQEQKTKIKGYRDYPAKSENPFAITSGLKAKRKSTPSHNRDLSLVNVQTGEEVEQVAAFTSFYEADEGQFIKLFVAGAKAHKDLTSAGSKVFFLLASEMQKNIGKDRVDLSYSMAKLYGLEMSRPTYTRGLRELFDKEFIYPISGYTSKWWINPNYIFNGSRIEFIKSYRRTSNNA
jgi:hypothetical protein